MGQALSLSLDWPGSSSLGAVGESGRGPSPLSEELGTPPPHCSLEPLVSWGFSLAEREMNDLVPSRLFSLGFLALDGPGPQMEGGAETTEDWPFCEGREHTLTGPL